MKVTDNELTEKLYKAFAGLSSEQEARSFLLDLCSIKEIQEMSQRLETANLLAQGMNYKEISEKLGVSSATVCRVSKALNYGEDGYTKALGLKNK